MSLFDMARSNTKLGVSSAVHRRGWGPMRLRRRSPYNDGATKEVSKSLTPWQNGHEQDVRHSWQYAVPGIVKCCSEWHEREQPKDADQRSGNALSDREIESGPRANYPDIK